MRATRIVGHPSLTLPSSASSHLTPSPPHALRNTLFVVVVSTLKKAVPISIQYLLTSVLVQLTRMPSVVTLTTQKGYTYAVYKTRNIFLKKTLGSYETVRVLQIVHLTKFSRNFFDPSNPNNYWKKILVKNGLTAIKYFGKWIFPHFLVAIADLTHPLSNNRSSVRIIDPQFAWPFILILCLKETM